MTVKGRRVTFTADGAKTSGKKREKLVRCGEEESEQFTRVQGLRLRKPREQHGQNRPREGLCWGFEKNLALLDEVPRYAFISAAQVFASSSLILLRFSFLTCESSPDSTSQRGRCVLVCAVHVFV